MQTQASIKIQLSQKKKFRKIEIVWWTFLVLTLIIGMISLIKGYFLQGMSSTNLTNAVPWGAWVAFYIYFIGMSAGSFLLSTLVYGFGMKQYERIGRSALLSAIVSMITAVTFIFLDIGRPDHVFNSIIYWNITSTMSWEIHFYIVYIILLMVELYFSMRKDLVALSDKEGLLKPLYRILTFGYTEISEAALERDRKRLKVLGILGIPTAILGVHGGTGSIFAVVKARPFLNTGLFPVIFILSALVSGTALSIAIYVIKNKVLKKPIDVPMVRSLGSMLTLFLTVELGMEWYEFLIGYYGLEGKELGAMHDMAFGPYAWSFWLFQMGLAMTLPLLILFIPKLNRSINWLLFASVITIVGVVGVRFNMVVPFLIEPVLNGLPKGFYYPNLSEWVTSFGLIALCLILYTLGEKILPIEELESEDGVGNYGK